jgi:hypothetical protein
MLPDPASRYSERSGRRTTKPSNINTYYNKCGLYSCIIILLPSSPKDIVTAYRKLCKEYIRALLTSTSMPIT